MTITISLATIFYFCLILLTGFAVWYIMKLKKQNAKLEEEYLKKTIELQNDHSETVSKLEKKLENIEEAHEQQLVELEELAHKREEEIVAVYTKNAKSQIEMLAFYQEYIINFSNIINFIDDEITKIDNKGTFKSDDEVGFFFTELTRMKNMLKEFQVKIKENFSDETTQDELK